MNETRTTSILQRVPAILAVTAMSYGLKLRAGGTRMPCTASERRGEDRTRASGKPAAHG